MAACIPSGLSADRMTSLVLVDQEVILSIGNLTKANSEIALVQRRSLPHQPLQDSGSGEGPAVFVGDGSVDVALKEGEHREPDAGPSALLVGPGVGQGVVIQEKSGGDVERDEHVDGVVLVCRQDEEDAEEVQDPG